MKSRRLALLLVGCAGLLILAGFAVFNINRSTLMKMLPAPDFEQVVLAGNNASHTVIDCKGGWFNDGKLTELVICSKRTPEGWDRPEDITIRNTRIRGAIRIIGMGRNGESPAVRDSSVKLGHTERAQAASPMGITISNVEIEADYRIPLYVAPGVTGVIFQDSKLTGWSCSTGIYLDCESADNVIRGNVLALRASREVIAVDGSARNHIENNQFKDPSSGGIYLYRNCGEAGTVRHQTPHGNLIAGNVFETTSLRRGCYGIWLGQRNGQRGYCKEDTGYNFGSSADDRDFANDNTLANNRFLPAHSRSLRDDGLNNRMIP
jgi:hypothetical protein